MIRIVASSIVMALGLVFMGPAATAATTTAPAAAPSWTSNDRLFVKAVRAQAPAFRSIPARDLIESAKLACEVLDTGYYTVFDVVDTAIEAGFSQKQAITLVAGAVVFYCPEYEDYV